MSTQTSPSPSSLNPEKADLVRAELDLIIRSQGFQRSDRHARFLRFVCEETLNGQSSQLNEYLIAHRVFDRGADYSPGEDSVVRRQAYTLRQKLQEYYSAEGKADPIRIELPVGRYVPTFEFRAELPQLPDTTDAVLTVPAPPSAVAEPRAKNRYLRWVALASAAAGLVALGWFAGAQRQRPAAADPVFRRVWGPLLSASEGSVICFSNALTAGIRRTDEPFPEETLTRGILLKEEEAKHIRSQFHLPEGGFFYINPSLAHAKMGEAMGTVPLTTMFARAGVPVRATQSRYLNWQDFRRQNLILLGHDEANQWLDPILSKLPLRQARTTSEKPRRIIITDPKAGERAEYYPDYSKGQNPPAEDYALISFLSSIDGSHGLALVNGVNTEGTMMALEYLTDPGSLRSLEASLKKLDANHSGPWHFQLILHSELRDGVPAGIEMMALRLVP
jgi:hypothetical protein